MFTHQHETIDHALQILGQHPLLEQQQQKAFTQIYKSYFSVLFRVARRRGLDEAVAEDLVQDLFLTLWHKRNGFFPEIIREKDELDKWLFSALWSRSANLKTKEKRFYSIDQETISSEVMLAITNSDVKAEYDLKEYEELLEHTIANLPWYLRVAYNLKRNKQYSMKQIAVMMGISVTCAHEYFAQANKEIESAMQHRYGVRPKLTD